jgi:ATP-dependent DNA helicase RecG
LDVSVLDEMPPGRTPVQTHLSYQHNSQKVQDFLRAELAKGHQVYWVFPLIQESAKSDLKDATSSFHKLQSLFSGYKIGLLHSNLEEEEKTRTMAEFQRGVIQILVATSVVEVGVDVPKATCMVIEHAERFGLSALHQLRGRVGRRDLPSYCFLLFPQELSQEAKSRIKVMKETNDGFQIAEEDLKLRGPGELNGQPAVGLPQAEGGGPEPGQGYPAQGPGPGPRFIGGSKNPTLPRKSFRSFSGSAPPTTKTWSCKFRLFAGQSGSEFQVGEPSPD